MNILYTVNDGFVPQLAASICSICENNKNVDDLTFYIIGYNITESNQSKLRMLVESYGNDLKIIPIGNLNQYLNFDFDTSTWNEVVLARLLVDKLIPKDLDRIIYLDADTIVIDDLSELWNYDLEDKVLGMSVEPTAGKDPMRDYPYHNSGVLLIDLNEWRKKNAGKRVIEYYRDNYERLCAPDQDALNAALSYEIAHLPPKFNFTNIYYHYNYKFFKKRMGNIGYFSKEVYDESMENPVIIHYIGEEKPWRYGSTHHYKDYYIKYNSMTEWDGEGFEDGWDNFFFCFKIFNKVTKHLPSLRFFIIDNFRMISRDLIYKK